MARIKPASSFVLLFCLVAVAGFLLVGCDDFAFDTLLDGDEAESPASATDSNTLAIFPSAITVLVTSSVTFTVGGGVSPYTFSVSAGLGSIGASSGVYNAPAIAGSATVRVTDTAGATSEAAVTISATGVLAITPPVVSLPANSSITFNAVGGTPPYVYSIVVGTGSIVPATGVFTAPAIADTTTVRVTDSLAATSDATVTITAFGGLNIVPSAITLYTNSVYTFSAAGGTAPYSYTKTAGDGSIVLATGEYTALGTAGTATVRVTDSLAATSDATVTVMAPLVIVPMSISVPADNNYTFSATGGTPPYSYTMESGLGSVVGGTGLYTAPGAAGTDEVRVTDADGSGSIATITVTAPQPLAIVPSTHIMLVNDTYTFSATGGIPPYTYSMVSGGLSIVGGTGLYTAVAVAGVAVVRVTDSAGIPATSDASITVVDPGVLAISPTSVDVEQGTTYDFSASGGTPVYSFSVAVGSGSVITVSATGQYTAPITLGAAETVRVTDAALNTADATVTIVPAAPSNLDADGTVGGPKDLQVTWTDNATGEDGFSVERATNGGGPYLEIATVGANVTFYLDADGSKTNNTVYFYRVRAYVLPVPDYSNYSNIDADIPNS